MWPMVLSIVSARRRHLSRLSHTLSGKRGVYDSRNVLYSFPTSLGGPFVVGKTKLVIYHRNGFAFSLGVGTFSTRTNRAIFVPRSSLFRILDRSRSLRLFVFVCRVRPVQSVVNGSITTVCLCVRLQARPYCM